MHFIGATRVEFTTTSLFLNLHSILPTLPTVSRENLSDQSESSSFSDAYHSNTNSRKVSTHNPDKSNTHFIGLCIGWVESKNFEKIPLTLLLFIVFRKSLNTYFSQFFSQTTLTHTSTHLFSGPSHRQLCHTFSRNKVWKNRGVEVGNKK